MIRYTVTLVAALAAVCISDTHAGTIVIDTFDGPEQQAPPDSDLEAPSAIGGRRFMYGDGEITGIVSASKQHLVVINADFPGGFVTVEWNGGGTLGMVDLTDGGSNDFIELAGVVASIGAVTETLTFSVTDSDGLASSVEIPWITLSAGSNLIPLSSLVGDADLTSIDVITLTTSIVVADVQIIIDAIRIVSVGACCLPNGNCEITSPVSCSVQGGDYQGDGTDCDSAPCGNDPVGACCFEDGSCQLNTEEGCSAQGGVYQGDDTDCDSVNCEPCLGDINGDGMVDGADLGLLLGAWGSDDEDADLNNDGTVDGADLGLLLGAWGECPD